MLNDIRVLDLSRLLPGPYASMVLADYGAQVDKLEDPKGGDYLRFMPPLLEGMNAAFHPLNRGKRSLVLDLKTDAGREALLAIVPSYDVVIESFRPGVMQRLGVGYEALAARHPGLIYCAISAYGQDGPLSDRPAHDLNCLGRSGALWLSGPQEGPPAMPSVQIADVGGAAMYAVTAILAALHSRASTGEGKRLDISMWEGAMAFATLGLASELGGLPAGPGNGLLTGGIAPYDTYLTKDGGAVTVAALEPKFWKRFCEAVGLEPDMSALMPGPHQGSIRQSVVDVIASRTRDEWAEFAETTHCCIEPVLSPEEALRSPQAVARNAAPEGAGGVPQPRSPGAPKTAIRAAPTKGQHSAEILREAGLSEEAIADLLG